MSADHKPTSRPVRGGAPSPFDSLRREIDHLFDHFHSDGWRLPFFGDAPRAPGPSGAARLALPMDLVERDKAYEIVAELPGIEEKDVEIKLVGDVLTIRGEKREERESEEKGYHLSERAFGSFQRSVRLPEGVDVEAISADFSNGVLTVRAPKSEIARTKERKILINRG